MNLYTTSMQPFVRRLIGRMAAALLILALAQTAWAQEFTLPFQVSDGTTFDTLAIGLNAAASDGIDGMDEQAPPPSVGDVFDTRVVNLDLYDGSTQFGFFQEFRAADPDTEVFYIFCEPASDGGLGGSACSFAVLDLTVWDTIPDNIKITIERSNGNTEGSGPFTPSYFEPQAWDTLGFNNPFAVCEFCSLPYADQGVVRVTVEIMEPLPVELSSFAIGAGEGNEIALEWTTLTERNNAGFDIERSTDGDRFSSIGFIEGNGTTLEPTKYRFVDALLPSNVSKLYYRLKQIDFDGKHAYSNVLEVAPPTPREFRLHGAYPNPFNPATQIGYELPEAQQVTLSVFDALGRVVRTLVDAEQPAGTYSVAFDAGGLPSGIYLYRIQAGPFQETGRMLLIK